MRCADFEKYLDDYCRGILDDRLAELVKFHIGTCGQCAALYKEHRSLLSLLDNEPKQVIDPAELADFLPGVWEKIQDRPRISIKGWAARLIPIAAIAALLALMIIKPSIDKAPIEQNGNEYLAYDYSGNPLFTDSYVYTDQDSLYTYDDYYSLLNGLFNDELESLEILEDEIYSKAGLFGNGSYDLEYLSEETLDLLDKKLEELISNAG